MVKRVKFSVTVVMCPRVWTNPGTFSMYVSVTSPGATTGPI